MAKWYGTRDPRHFQGIDASGTPVLDIKPYMLEFAARGEVR
jgi:tRNA (Thr-GGU) A37 N-methylase